MPMSTRKSCILVFGDDSAIIARSHGLGAPRERMAFGKKARGLELTRVSSPVYVISTS